VPYAIRDEFVCRIMQEVSPFFMFIGAAMALGFFGLPLGIIGFALLRTWSRR
jgi:hypothetical protein